MLGLDKIKCGGEIEMVVSGGGGGGGGEGGVPLCNSEMTHS